MPSAIFNSRDIPSQAKSPARAGKSVDVTPAPKTLEERIYDRIQRRLGPRIRNLRVSIQDKAIRLMGECTTYYSKQLAQHAALGVIEDESLENAIEVSINR